MAKKGKNYTKIAGTWEQIKPSYNDLEDVPTSFTPTSHEHTAADIDSQTATDGYVLTADGSGGAAWEAVSGNFKSYSWAPKIVYWDTGGTNAGFRNILKVESPTLSSGGILYVDGTTNSVVVNSKFEIMVNHHQDIVVKSLSGGYTQVRIRVQSDANDAFNVLMARDANTPDETTLNAVFIPFDQNATVTTYENNPAVAYSSMIHEHQTIAFSENITATGGSTGKLYVEGNEVWHAGNAADADDKVSKAGDTMTGELTIAPTSGVSKLNINAVSGQNSQILLKEAGTLKSAITYVAGNDKLAFYHEGADRLTIDSSGNVGIGTTSPSSKLHIVGDTRIEGDLTVNGTYTQIDTNTNTTEQWIVTNDGTGPAAIINQIGAHPVLDVQDDGVSALYVADGGNVGIGTTSPSSKLTIESSTATAGDAVLNIRTTPGNITAGSTAIGGIYFSTQDASGGGTGDVAGITVIAGDGTSAYTGAGRPADLVFYTQPLGASASLTEAMRIDQDGNVGIGTTSPQSKLHIENGFARTSTSDNTISLQTSTDTDAYRVGLKTSLIGGASAGVRTLVLQSGANNSGDGTFGNSGERLSLNPNGGNVGIGTDNPTGKLTVFGETHHYDAAGVKYMNSDPRWEGNTGRLHIWATTAAGATYGSAGLALWDGDSYHTIDSIGNKILIDGNEAWHAGNFNPSSYLPLSSGTLTGDLTIAKDNPVLIFKDTSTPDNNNLAAWISFKDQNNSEKGWMGYGYTTDTNMTFSNTIGNINLTPSGNVGIGTASPTHALDVVGEMRLAVAPGTANAYGRVNGGDQYHSIVMRGNISGTTSQTVNPGDSMTFAEYGGVFRFKQLSDTVNTDLVTITPDGIQSNVAYRQGAYYKKVISLPGPPANSGNGRWFIRLWQTSAGATFSGGRIRAGGTWNYAAIMGHIEIDYGVYVAASATSITSGSTRFRSGTSSAYDNLRFSDLTVVSGYVGFYIWSSNTNAPYVEFDLYCTRTPLFEALAWESNTLPAQRPIEIQKDLYVAANVGIGTTSPASKVQIVGGAVDNVGTLSILNTYASGGAMYPALRVVNTYSNHSYGTVAEFRTENASGSDRPSMLFSSNHTAATWTVGQGGYSANDNFAITYRSAHPNDVGVWGTSRLMIDTSGRVGIGTTSPTEILDVVGNVKVADTIYFLRGGTEYSNYIRSQNYPSKGYTGASDKYWIEYGAKGGHHFVVDTDGGTGAGTNTMDNFTVWKGVYDSVRLLQVDNGGNTYVKGSLTVDGSIGKPLTYTTLGSITMTTGSVTMNTSPSNGLDSIVTVEIEAFANAGPATWTGPLNAISTTATYKNSLWLSTTKYGDFYRNSTGTEIYFSSAPANTVYSAKVYELKVD